MRRLDPHRSVRGPKARVLLAACGIVCLLGATAASQELADTVQLSIGLTPDSLTVGDRVTARLRVHTDGETQVHFPPEPRLGSAVDVIAFEELPPRAADTAASTASGKAGEQIWEATWTLALYGVGEQKLPPFRVQVQRGSDTAELATDSVYVYVASVLDDSLAAAGLVDIKQQRDLSIPLPLWVWIVLGVLGVAALIAWWRWRRRNRLPVQVIVEPPRPAHELALAALVRLEHARLPYEGRIKEHYIQLSEILRGYLEAAPVFRIPALEETTDEILRSLQQRGTKAERIQHVKLLCEEADLVKFAKHQPPVDECMEGIERVADFVRQTSRPEPGVTPSDEAVLAALDQATRATASSGGPPAPEAQP